LDGACKAVPKTYPTDPRDPEDLALGTNGTIWVGDIGDKDKTRQTVAFHTIASGASTAVTNRMVYTDGVKDAKAFLLDGDDKPIILANVADQPGATLYKPSKALVPNSSVKADLPTLAKVGQFTPEKTGTSNPTSESQVTGAAKSPDGKKVVIRTLADAYEWDVPDGDVVKAITTGKPRITPLPDEPEGEAISYTADGTKFVTIGFKTSGATENPKLLSYTPFVPAAAADNGAAAGGPASPPASSGQSWLSKVTLAQLTRVVAAVGVVGLVLAIAGIVGIRRARKRRREEEDEYDDDYDDYDDRPRRGRGGPRGDEQGYGPREPQYDDQYGAASGAGYADAGYGAANGYGANGYGANAYAEPGGYGQPAPANGYGPPEQYGAEAYGQQQGQYGPQEYGGQAGYDGYGQQQYGAEQYGAEQYGADQYGGQQQYAPEYGADPYGAPAPQQYGEQGQQYGDQGQQYGGYGYDEYDQSHDPRRR
jgi:hypothetical protein